MGSTSQAREGLAKIEGNLNTLEAEKIARNSGLSFSEVVALAKSQNIGVSEAAKDNARAYTPPPAAAPVNFTPSPPPQYVAAPPPPSPSPSPTPSPSPSPTPSPSPSPAPPAPASSGEQVVPFANIPLAQQGANLATEKSIARLKEAAATERLRYEVDNRIPQIQAEAKGQMDLQKIVNAGYKNIKRLESTSNMFSSLMAAFNF
jgi:outer membrane biosynthesis protein TonB